MATQIYLGAPPQHIIDWIKAHSKPAVGPKTRITFADGGVEEYDWKGFLTIQTMIDAKLVNPEGLNNPETTEVWLRKPTAVEIGTDVTGLAMTFYMCGGLTGVTIPDSVKDIGRYAFGGCSSLTGVTIPNSVSSIGQAAFGLCNSFTSVTIPDSVISVGERAFYMCDNLTSIVVQGRMTEDARGMLANAGLSDINIVIGNKKPMITFTDGTSQECNWSGEITLQTMIDARLHNGSSWIKEPQTVEFGLETTSIGDSLFQGCTNLTSVTIPSSVTSIRSNAFSGCTSLMSVVVWGRTTVEACELFANAGLQNTSIVKGTSTLITFKDKPSQKYGWYGKITNQTMKNSGLYSDDHAVWIKEPQTVELGFNVTSIDEQAFRDCTDLTSIMILGSVTNIGEEAFYKCPGLTDVTIPDSVTSIGDRAFAFCNGLTSVTIGNGVTHIGEWAFEVCTGLTSITIPDSVTSVGKNVFASCSNLTSIVVEGKTTEQARALLANAGLSDINIVTGSIQA